MSLRDPFHPPLKDHADWQGFRSAWANTLPKGGNPWLEGFGRSAKDPDFEEYLREIQQARSADALE